MSVPLWLPLVASGAYLAGRALHELTHAAVVWANPHASIDSISLSHCAYRGVSQYGKDVIDGATIPGFLLLVSFCQSVLYDGSLTADITLAALYLAYLPRSDTDWRPWRRLAGRVANGLNVGRFNTR